MSPTPSSSSALALLVIVALAPAQAEHCWSLVGEPDVDTTPLGLSLYVDNDVCQPECAMSAWVYEESNGIAGLQRADPVIDDTCHGLIAGDTLVLGTLDGNVYSGALP